MWLRMLQLLLGLYVLLQGRSVRGLGEFKLDCTRLNFPSSFPFKTQGRLLKFTNVKCSDLPTSEGITRYDYCRLKVVKRNLVELSLRVSLLKLPITNMTCRLQCFQRSVGYRPFMYNVYFDFCRLMAAASKYGFSFERFVFDAIRKHSNFNHTCPWTEVGRGTFPFPVFLFSLGSVSHFLELHCRGEVRPGLCQG